jgi:hypothetical protein
MIRLPKATDVNVPRLSSGLRATFITSHSYIRSATGWSHVGGTHPSSVADGLCPESMVRR